MVSFAFLVQRKIESKLSINQRTHAQFPHNKKANDEQENDMVLFLFFYQFVLLGIIYGSFPAKTIGTFIILSISILLSISSL